jgi:hypothetical protein
MSRRLSKSLKIHWHFHARGKTLPGGKKLNKDGLSFGKPVVIVVR